MALDVWFKTDIKQVLLLAKAAGRNNDPAYLQAVEDIAIGFGVSLESGPSLWAGPYEVEPATGAHSGRVEIEGRHNRQFG